MTTLPPDCELLLSTFPDLALAQAVADELVLGGFAACVQIGAPVHSTYSWEGKLEHATEYPLQAKLSQAQRAGAIATIQRHHPYAVPEIICLPICAGLPAYLEWITACSTPAPAGPQA
ncbi:divalent-cation tolerance protein CutA [Kerstersia gyiorum]|uniref:divalent-cation tolerance protein CutA n=1 Tax=Kerstersia gyiorum TaxID=206506 RepID=UPI003B42AEFE